MLPTQGPAVPVTSLTFSSSVSWETKLLACSNAASHPVPVALAVRFVSQEFPLWAPCRDTNERDTQADWYHNPTAPKPVQQLKNSVRAIFEQTQASKRQRQHCLDPTSFAQLIEQPWSVVLMIKIHERGRSYNLYDRLKRNSRQIAMPSHGLNDLGSSIAGRNGSIVVIVSPLFDDFVPCSAANITRRRVVAAGTMP